MACVKICNCVVVPPALQQEILRIPHSGHPGMVHTKGLAGGYVWGPGLDEDVECQIRGCTACQQTQNASPQAPVHPWETATGPWLMPSHKFCRFLPGKQVSTGGRCLFKMAGGSHHVVHTCGDGGMPDAESFRYTRNSQCPCFRQWSSVCV